jgi:hypothetical protein
VCEHHSTQEEASAAFTVLYGSIGRAAPPLTWLPSAFGDQWYKVHHTGLRGQRRVSVALERRIWERVTQRLPADLARELDRLVLTGDNNLLNSVDSFYTAKNGSRGYWASRPKTYRQLGLGWTLLYDVLCVLRESEYVTQEDRMVIDALGVVVGLGIVATGSNRIVVVAPPTHHKVDEQFRWHMNNGRRAFSWPDAHDGREVGYAMVHGVVVDKQTALLLSAPENITLLDIVGVENIEVRRTLCEAAGWDRVVADAHLALIDMTPDPGNPGYFLELYNSADRLTPVSRRDTVVVPGVLGTVQEVPATNILLCTNAHVEPDGTYKRYGLLVPSAITSALEAMAWTFGVSQPEYAGLARAT